MRPSRDGLFKDRPCASEIIAKHSHVPILRLQLGWAAILIAAIVLSHPIDVAAQTPLIRFSPEQTRVVVDEEAEVEVLIDDVDGLYGLEIRVAFDPNVLEVVDVDSGRDGIQIEEGQFPYPDFSVKNQADNDSGMIWYTVTQLSPRDPVSGSGIVMIIHFRAKALGTNLLTFEYVVLAGRGGMIIDSEAAEGQVAVVAFEGGPTSSPGPTRTPLPSKTPTITRTLRPTVEPSETPRAKSTAAGDYPPPGMSMTPTALPPVPTQATVAAGESPYPMPSQVTVTPEPRPSGVPPTKPPISVATHMPGPTYTPSPVTQPTAAALPSVEPPTRTRPTQEPLDPLIPPETFNCLAVLLFLFTFLLLIYLVRRGKGAPR